MDAARVGVVDAQPSGAAGGAGWSSAVMLESARRWVRISEREKTVWRTLNWAAVAAEQQQLFTERLANWQDKYPDVEVRLVVARDRPVRRMLDAATGARMLVVGSRGRGGIPGMLLGSTSQSLLSVAPCPVAIVRH